MTNGAMRQEIDQLLDTLPDPKLAVVLDFVKYIAERETQAGWLTAQTQAGAYQEWTSEENDIYDEVFADVDPTW